MTLFFQEDLLLVLAGRSPQSLVIVTQTWASACMRDDLVLIPFHYQGEALCECN